MKNSSTLGLIILLALLAGLLGYNYFAQPFRTIYTPSPIPETESVSPEETSSQIEEQLNQLSSSERIAQIIAVPLVINDITDQVSSDSALVWVDQYKPGFVTLFGSNVSMTQAQTTIADVKKVSASLPIRIAVDHEGGTVQRFNGKGFTVLPSWSGLCDLVVASRSALLTQSAQELAITGVDIVLAPVVDLSPLTSGSNHRVLESRLCDSDPKIVIERAAEFVTIFKKSHILPVLKHFPGIGQTTRDLHQQFDRVTVTATEAGIYRSLLETYPQLGVMTSHVGVINQYPDLPCSLSQACVGELSQNFPRVLLFSDALEMKAASYQPEASGSPTRSLDDIAIAAIRAGNHVLIFGEAVDVKELNTVHQQLLQLYQEEEEFRYQVDEAVTKIIEYKNNQ